MITIEGLTPAQIEICDMIWNMEGHDEIYQWIDSLPTEIGNEAISLLWMMTFALIDDSTADITEFPDAVAVINKVR